MTETDSETYLNVKPEKKPLINLTPNEANDAVKYAMSYNLEKPKK